MEAFARAIRILRTIFNRVRANESHPANVTVSKLYEHQWPPSHITYKHFRLYIAPGLRSHFAPLMDSYIITGFHARALRLINISVKGKI